jgi:hypothetical protein
MTQGLCPLCGKLGCLTGEARSGPNAVSYECQTHCGAFRVKNTFLKYVWSIVTQEDKQAIAAYMHATRGPQRAAPLIQGDNYREYAAQGRALQRSARRSSA